ncbi:amidohydrolase family protein [Gangjinia marincola]|uniref:Amidohydrolase family protein n=1 Tax=Gangjinia marincola TaxID=578463 RepID=A0ABN1MGM9_9FLAO
MKILVQIIVLSLTVHVFSQDRFVINNATVFDGEEVYQNTSVLVEDGSISKVAKKIKFKGEVIDGTGKFLMPAMMNTHVHAWSPASTREAAQNGILHLFDMHGMEEMQKGMKAMNADSTSARYLTAGYAATAKDGHGTQYGFPVPVLEKPEDAKQWVKDRVDAGADHIKIIVEPWKNTLSYDVVEAIINEAHTHDKVAVVHVSHLKDAVAVLKRGADGLVHIWDDENMSPQQLIELTKEHDFFVIPTIITNYLVQEAYFNKTKEEATEKLTWLQRETKALYDAGIPILAGTDPPNANINYSTDLFKEMQYFKDAGIPALGVLKTATSNPAKQFKLEKVGYIKPGFTADLVLLDKNPLLDMNNLSTTLHVWKAGKYVK